MHLVKLITDLGKLNCLVSLYIWSVIRPFQAIKKKSKIHGQSWSLWKMKCRDKEI